MRVILLGTGAMACLFAARLSGVAEVTLLGTWSEAIQAITKQGIIFSDAENTRTIRVRAEHLGASLPKADLILVLVKSWQTERTEEFIPRYLNREGVAVSLQNGLGNIELLGNRAYAGTTSEGATLLAPGHVKSGGSGLTHVVAPSWVVSFLNKAGFECLGCSRAEAEGLLWGKLAISCGINAITALLRVKNGELLKWPPAEEVMAKASLECEAVAKAKGIRLPFEDTAVRVREVADKTAGNSSSMLQDILRGAPTECDAINGAVAREGERLGVATPVNHTLWQLIRAVVHQNGRKA